MSCSRVLGAKFFPQLLYSIYFYVLSYGGDEDLENIEPVELPIDGILDLHAFQSREVRSLLPEYLMACRRKGILDVRIIHGKGAGTLREVVHSLLRRLPEVVSFRLAGQDAGGWGATVVLLTPMDEAHTGKD